MNPGTERLRISQQSDGAYALVGEIDTHTAPLISSELNEFPEERSLHINLAQVTFIDSSGLRVLIELHKSREAANAKLVLEKISPSVEKLLQITGLTDHLHIAE